MQISHIGSCIAMGQMIEGLEIIREAIINGIDVTADCYPYDAFSTKIEAVFLMMDVLKIGYGYDAILLTEEPYRNVICTEEIFKKVRRRIS